MRPDDPVTLIRRLAKRLYRRGWMEGTAGNLSLRQGDTLFITASGCPKGALSPEEVLSLPANDHSGGIPQPGPRPSAELSIHQVIYRLFPDTTAVLHVHTVEAALVSSGQEDFLILPPLEVLKGLGVSDPRQCPPLPVFDNDLLVWEIARKIETRLPGSSFTLPGLLIRHHGTTVWGETLNAALRHLELLEFCFRYMVANTYRATTDKS